MDRAVIGFIILALVTISFYMANRQRIEYDKLIHNDNIKSSSVLFEEQMKDSLK